MFHHPHQGRFGRVLVAMALTAVLSVAAPAWADAAGRAGSTGVWRWLEGLWEGGIGAVIRDWTAAAPAASPLQAIRAQDACPPTGCPPGTPGTGTPTQGGVTDPDGKP
jgi:hypothetical protein